MNNAEDDVEEAHLLPTRHESTCTVTSQLEMDEYDITAANFFFFQFS